MACAIASRGEDDIAGRGGTDPRPAAEGWEARLGRGGLDCAPGRGGACDGERDIELAAASGTIDSLVGSGFTEAVAPPGGFDADRPAPSSNIAAIRAAFVGEAGSTDAEGAGGIEDPPFFSRVAGFDRDVGLDTGVPSGARRTT